MESRLNKEGIKTQRKRAEKNWEDQWMVYTRGAEKLLEVSCSADTEKWNVIEIRIFETYLIFVL